jgi:hypothetical protein
MSSHLGPKQLDHLKNYRAYGRFLIIAADKHFGEFARAR